MKSITLSPQMPNLEEYNMQLTATDVTKVIKGKTVLSHINLSLNSGYIKKAATVLLNCSGFLNGRRIISNYPVFELVII